MIFLMQKGPGSSKINMIVRHKNYLSNKQLTKCIFMTHLPTLSFSISSRKCCEVDCSFDTASSLSSKRVFNFSNWFDCSRALACSAASSEERRLCS